MATEMLIQLGILVFTLGIFYAIYNLPKRAFTRIRFKDRSDNQAHQHFIQGAQLLSRARSSRSKSTALKFAKAAGGEADKALALDPRDPAALILKALVLDLMGHKTAALKSLDAALSPPGVKELSERERGDALFKRAELQVALNRRRRVASAVADLEQAVKLSPDNANAYCLLGRCYEIEGLKEEARRSFQHALKIEPDLATAREGMAHLGPNCIV
nr:Small glutamine-rich tetratricopeptide repeat-containing protein [Ipomoea batatas]